MGMMMIDHVETKFVNGVAFSNGCAELTLKNPPPLVPSCLIAIWLAAGPPGMSCTVSDATAGSIGVASV